MTERDALAATFEEHRDRLRAVAYRMLGSLGDADDAVQETWLRLQRSEDERVENLPAWLTTVVSRVCLNILRSRRQRLEEPLDAHVPDPVVTALPDPEEEAVLADSVGLALLVVLETLTPAERLAFVLHDLFAMPFEEIAPIVGRTPAAARQLASRARRRVQGTAPEPERNLARQREVVDAFVAASRGGDLDALLAVLDPDVLVRNDGGTARPSLVRRGARAAAQGAITFATSGARTTLAIVNGSVGAISYLDGKPASIAAFTVVDGKIVELDILTDPERLARIDPSAV